jgi:hypothetical protein
MNLIQMERMLMCRISALQTHYHVLLTHLFVGNIGGVLHGTICFIGKKSIAYSRGHHTENRRTDVMY